VITFLKNNKQVGSSSDGIYGIGKVPLRANTVRSDVHTTVEENILIKVIF
jgi:hypothetical protein